MHAYDHISECSYIYINIYIYTVFLKEKKLTHMKLQAYLQGYIRVMQG
jgi:hypothetical protein